MIDLSIIIPCYNEEPHLRVSFEKILWVLKKMKVHYEIIFVEDKSQDNTKKVIEKIVHDFKNEDIKCIFHPINIGRGGSVNDGIVKAQGDVVGFLDIDLEISEVYIPIFYWKIKEGADLAVANRSYDFTFSKLIRFIASKGYSFVVKLFLKVPVKDTEAGYKFFKKEKILPVCEKVEDKKWFWDTEIIMRSYLAGLKIIEIPVIFVRNPTKKSTVKVVPDSIEYFKKLIKFKREMDR